MFRYTETNDSFESKNGTLYRRSVLIWDGVEKIGEITVLKDASGNIVPTDHWRKETPLSVAYYEPETERNGYRREQTIGWCKSVIEGKAMFTAWYSENAKGERTSAARDVRRLPASPDAEFFPTPSALAGQMAALVDWKQVRTILEPSAGKGDLIDCAAIAAVNMGSNRFIFRSVDKLAGIVDCIEIDENLRHILSGKGYRVVHDDFLTFDSVKHYDLVLMNPPFSNGDEHLLHAIAMQKEYGGQIVCLLNAETIRNPYTNRRKVLADALAEYGATIRFVSGAFEHAERKSDVEVAIIHCNIPTPHSKSILLDGLERAAKEQARTYEPTEMVSGDWIDRMVAAYMMEAKAGVALMNEFNAIAPYISDGDGRFEKPLIQLSLNDRKVSCAGSDEVNEYLQLLRYKYWSSMMNKPELTSRMTSKMQSEYREKVNELKDYDFTRVNVERVIREISGQLCHGIEDSIMGLFEQLSAKHAWYPECQKNVHYFNGWATNKAHKVNNKVILPINGFDTTWDGKKKLEARNFSGTICDIERALSYLDGDGAICRIDPAEVSSIAEECQRTTVQFSYFDATFYKKGTCHIRFHDDAKILVDRMNIFAARQRAWLPPTYGKKHYEDMSNEEQSVIDDFQGKSAYENIMKDPQRYIISPTSAMPLLTA